MREGIRFLATSLILLAAFYYALGFVAEPLAGVTAALSQFALGALGEQTQLEWSAGTPHLVNERIDAEIGELCWGRLELAVLAATILASVDRSRRQRLAGVALGAVLALGVFNPLRIAVSARWVNEFVHDVLFRATLLALLVGFYALWYLALTRGNGVLSRA
ncbi:MAG: hypothetical protein WC607_03130 [Candidatus Micrarchaeia archaeon]